MIVTHTQNATGQQRVYLGGKGSIECWIEPKADKRTWTFHMDASVAGNRLTDAEHHQWAIYTLTQLANELNVAPDELAATPFENIAALHNGDPFSGRRIAVPRRKAIDAGFMSTQPNVRRPQADFTANDYQQTRRQAR